ncbi:MAG: GNAT family N-acetyltransferase [Candidatus Aminicenantes bacterium]|nr:GNAT family N-acetyltransferase [Candidatus Aminicenantes bacterium]
MKADISRAARRGPAGGAEQAAGRRRSRVGRLNVTADASLTRNGGNRGRRKGGRRLDTEGFKFKVRKYRMSDLTDVLHLVRDFEAELARKFPEVRIQSGLNNYKTRYLKPGTRYETFLAAAGGRIIGYMIGRPSLGSPEVDTMYDILTGSARWKPPEYYLQITFVSEPFRNKGVSTELHRKVIEHARRKGYKEIYACIAKWNRPELAVIESCGFFRLDLGSRYRLSLKL